MTPREVIDALIANREIVDLVCKAILGEKGDVEHYFALEMKDGKLNLAYEYYGNPLKIPYKFIDDKLIPLHSHVGLEITDEIASILKCSMSKRLKHEMDLKHNKILGSSFPSKEDLITFISNGTPVFGVCSLYNGYIRISFYDPTLDEDVLRQSLITLFDKDNEVERFMKTGANIEEAAYLVKKNLGAWFKEDCLLKLTHAPYAAHLIIPL